MVDYRNYIGVRAKIMKPTKKHRPAIWECMLGTVYAQNDSGEIRYFDYKWEDAIKFAGATADRDPRFAPYKERHFDNIDLPRINQRILWITQK